MDLRRRKLLPRLAKPILYTLKFQPQHSENIFDGEVEISMVAIRKTNSVHLNSVDLQIQKATLTCRGIKEMPVDVRCNVQDIADQKVVLKFPGQIGKGQKFSVHLKYTGPFKKTLSGLYQSAYEDGSGTMRYLAMTHMEPTHARRVFPCFDEPALKAEFLISVVARKTDCCLSNMPIMLEEDFNREHKLVKFFKTMRMSTYLVALVTGPLASQPLFESNINRVPVSVFTPIGMEDDGRFALDLAIKGLKFYEDIFQSPYPLPKLDLVAVPDFAAGAMENWGLLIFRTSELLVNVAECTLAKRKRVTEVVLHELSHQWFGNLATMKFWDGLWLNEGFANWMSYFACDKMFPEWHIWQDFVNETLQTALELDALRSSHPVEVRISDANDIGQVFDSISYRKGSSVLRMIAKTLGESALLAGVKIYLSQHALGSTTTLDLWKALGEASNSNVGTIMGIWTRKVGFPVVTVRELHGSGKACDGSQSKIMIRQNRFLAAGPVESEEDEQLYPLRISAVTTQGIQEFRLFERETSIPIDPSTFIKINAGHDGFYRTAYSAARLQKIGEAARQGLLSVEDGIGILADAAALTASGYQETSSLFALYQSMRFSKEYLIWTQMVKGLQKVRYAWRFKGDAVNVAIKRFAADLFGRKAAEIGWNITKADDEALQQLKALVFEAAGSAGDATILDAIHVMFERFVSESKVAPHPELRDAVFSLSLEYGGEKEFEYMVNIFRFSENEEERYCALENMGCVSTPCLVERTLAFAFSNAVRNQDLHLLIWCLNASAAGAEGVWRWAKENWQKIDEAFHSDLLRILVPVILGGLSTQEQMKDVTSFFENRDTSLYDRVLKQELEKISARQQWSERDELDLRQWLRAEGFSMSPLWRGLERSQSKVTS